jgi:hypothetical protein
MATYFQFSALVSRSFFRWNIAEENHNEATFGSGGNLLLLDWNCHAPGVVPGEDAHHSGEFRRNQWFFGARTGH